MPYGATVQPVDYSYIGQAATTLGTTIKDLPAAADAMQKRKLLEENLKRLGLRKQDAELIRRTRVNEAVDEYKQKMGVTDENQIARFKTKVEAMFWPDSIIGDNPDESLKLMSDNDTKYAAYFDKLVLDKTKKESTAAAQTAAAGGKRYSPEVDTGQGFTEQTITSLAPAKTQEEAMGRYGEMATKGEAPLQTTEDLKKQPSIAALPETPKKKEDDPLFDLRKRNLELRNATEIAREAALKAAAQQRGDKPETEGIDKALDSVIDTRFTLDRSIREDTKLISALNKAIKDAQDDNMFSIQTSQMLAEVGAGDLPADMTVLKNVLKETQIEQERKKAESAELKKTERELIKTGKGPVAQSRRAASQAMLKEATNFIQSNIAPRISTMHGSVKQVIEQLPPKYQGPIQEKIAELKNVAAERSVILSDSDILQMLFAKPKVQNANQS